MPARVVYRGNDFGRVLELKAASEKELEQSIDLVRSRRCPGIKTAQGLYMHLTFNCLTSSAPSTGYEPSTVARKIARTVHDFPNIKALHLVRGRDGSELPLGLPDRFYFFVNDGTETNTFRADRFEFFVMHLADAFQQLCRSQLQVLETPCCFPTFTRDFDTDSDYRYSNLKVLKLTNDNGRCGDSLVDMISNLDFRRSLMCIELKGTSANHGFSFESFADIVMLETFRDKGGPITDIAVPGHQEFTILELVETSQCIIETNSRPLALRQLTLPFPQHLTEKTLQAYNEQKRVVWDINSSFKAAAMIQLMLSTIELHSQLESITFSREDEKPLKVDIRWDEEGTSYYSQRIEGVKGGKGNRIEDEFPHPHPSEVQGFTGQDAWEALGDLMIKE